MNVSHQQNQRVLNPYKHTSLETEPHDSHLRMATNSNAVSVSLQIGDFTSREADVLREGSAPLCRVLGTLGNILGTVLLSIFTK